MTAAPVTVTMDRSAGEVDRSLERGHILALDGLRGIAILLVVACHFVSNLRITADGWASPLVAFAHAGWAGVDLFFVLSGFLITGILVDARGSSSYFKAFYARRVLRILPAYYGFLFVIFVVLPALHVGAGDNAMLARQHQGWYWLHLTNVMMALDELPGHGPYPSTLFWSLAVEEQFYFIWPAIVALCSTNTLRKVCIAGVIGCIVLRIAGGLSGVSWRGAVGHSDHARRYTIRGRIARDRVSTGRPETLRTNREGCGSGRIRGTRRSYRVLWAAGLSRSRHGDVRQHRDHVVGSVGGRDRHFGHRIVDCSNAAVTRSQIFRPV